MKFPEILRSRKDLIFKIVSFGLSPLLIVWSFFVFGFKHQHAGLAEDTERRDFILWGIYASAYLICAIEILLSWINRRAVSKFLLLTYYYFSFIVMVIFIWKIVEATIFFVDGNLFHPEILFGCSFFFGPLIVPQAFLVYVWCYRPIKRKKSSGLIGPKNNVGAD